jgi:uncharacterized membrane protein YgcG
MKKHLVLLLFCGAFFTTHSFSQGKVRGSVKGVVLDSIAGKTPLSNATISVRPLGADSSEAEYTVSDKKGAFRFTSLSAGQYYLLITYEGYAHLGRDFSITATNPDIDLSTLLLQRADKMLAEVIVQRPPMQVKKDTFEYNAGNFAVKPNAVAEDLLKKMPGVTVGKDGSIQHAGETVQRVMVDGKRFFSDDPKLATRNLPPDIIDKIQVFDDLSDQSKFTGFDDGNRVKTINIVTKKNTRKGYFGKVIAGAGSNQDYEESINMHRFDGDQQISLLGQANDLNKQNFTPQDIFGGGGGGRRGGGGGGGGFGGGGGNAAAGTSPSSTGVTTIWAGGANYRNSFSPKTDFYGSYFYNQQHVGLTQQDSSISPIKSSSGEDSSSVTSGGQQSYTRIESHRIFLNLEERFDSSNSLIFRPNITFQHSNPNGYSHTVTYDNNLSPVLSQVGQTSSSNSGFNINGSNLQLRHRFRKPGRTISLDVNGTVNTNNGWGYNYSVNHYYRLDSTKTINQNYNDSLRSAAITPTLSYTEPLGRHMMLQLNYNHNYTNNRTINNTYAFDNTTKAFTSFDSLFSNSYKFVSNADQVSLAWRVQKNKLNLSVGSGIQWTRFNSDNTTKDITVKHNYTTFNPTVNLSYTISPTSHLRFFYNGRTGTPSPSQLQPLTTTSDSVSFQVGNPNLKPQFTHSIRMLYANFDPSTQHVIFATINASTIVNDIQSAIYRNSTLGQTSTYVNLNGTYSINGYFNYGFPLKRPKSNMNFITTVNYSQSQSLQATDSLTAAHNLYTHLYTRNTVLSETLSWTTNIKKNFDMNLSSASAYTINGNTGLASSTRAKTDSSVSSNSNLNSFSETVSTEFTAYTNSGWLIAATFDYTYTYTHSNTFNASIPLLTPSIAKQLFKKKNGELRLSVFDVLGKNTAVSKTVGTGGAVTYQRTNVLTRYAMLTFTWNLNNFAGSNQRRMPGFFPGRFRGGGGGGRGGGGFDGPGGLYPIY